ncbi:hypothetical protein QJS04_geneDACA012518 [Acorus gramineus]|uniref:FAD-binding domain-containing protein n=1 Tax=Acorus gramineus TaxID=55184 RepID=A0AAV9BC37_ACOGR|nr:hypothetical protein QJS04_geneDACA012518 [Acorus gramineus]
MRGHQRSTLPLLVRSTSGDHPSSSDDDVTIVGAGIAGLATALSLHRLGVRSRVLEQAESLRTGGTSLTLFNNGWRVLDEVGVGDGLRRHFLQIQGLSIRSEEGRELRSFSFQEEAKGQEVRAVERKLLLESFMDQLPPDTVRFSSRLAAIQRNGSNGVLLELEDGMMISSKIVIGCDGVRSLVARWMGYPEPRYSGHCAFRGLAIYADGQPFEPKVHYIYGKGLRAGYVPLSPTKVYWFICFNSPSPGRKISDSSLLKKKAQDMVKSWPSEILDVIDKTLDETISKTPLVDRWLWPWIRPSGSSGRVVLAGDAWHPMTPNLGQGACCALEDAVILSSKLAGALGRSKEGNVERALEEYTQERWPRIFPLTIRANVVGSLLQWENPVVCAVRDNIVIPKLVRLGPLLEHTYFECELKPGKGDLISSA